MEFEVNDSDSFLINRLSAMGTSAKSMCKANRKREPPFQSFYRSEKVPGKKEVRMQLEFYKEFTIR